MKPEAECTNILADMMIFFIEKRNSLPTLAKRSGSLTGIAIFPMFEISFFSLPYFFASRGNAGRLFFILIPPHHNGEVSPTLILPSGCVFVCDIKQREIQNVGRCFFQFQPLFFCSGTRRRASLAAREVFLEAERKLEVVVKGAPAVLFFSERLWSHRGVYLISKYTHFHLPFFRTHWNQFSHFFSSEILHLIISAINFLGGR